MIFFSYNHMLHCMSKKLFSLVYNIFHEVNIKNQVIHFLSSSPPYVVTILCYVKYSLLPYFYFATLLEISRKRLYNTTNLKIYAKKPSCTKKNCSSHRPHMIYANTCQHQNPHRMDVVFNSVQCIKIHQKQENLLIYFVTTYSDKQPTQIN